MDEIIHCAALGLSRDRPADECHIMVIGECLVVSRRTMRGDGDFTFKHVFSDHVDHRAARKAATSIAQGLRREGLTLRQVAPVREFEEHPDYVRRWLDGVRSGRNDESDLYKVFVRIVSGMSPLAAVTA